MKNRFYKNLRNQSGQAMAEYVMVAMLLIGAFFTPMPPAISPAGETPIEMLIRAFKQNYAAYEWGMSMPD